MPESEKKAWRDRVIALSVVAVLVGILIAVMRIEDPEYTSRPTVTPTPLPTATPAFSEWKAQAEEMPYRTLFRYAEDNTGKLIYYEGSVVQVIEAEGGFQLRVDVTPVGLGLWTDTVFLHYPDPPVRVLEGDLIEFVGRMNGTITYELVMEVDITIPELIVLSLIINSE